MAPTPPPSLRFIPPRAGWQLVFIPWRFIIFKRARRDRDVSRSIKIHGRVRQAEKEGRKLAIAREKTVLVLFLSQRAPASLRIKQNPCRFLAAKWSRDFEAERFAAPRLITSALFFSGITADPRC